MSIIIILFFSTKIVYFQLKNSVFPLYSVFLTTSTLTPINERFLIDHSIYAAVKLPEKKFDRAKGKKGGKKQEIIEEDEESDEEDDKNYIDEATIATPQ